MTAPPEADVQALADRIPCTHVLEHLLPIGLSSCRVDREMVARAVLAAGYRPAPEPTDQTREQIAAVRLTDAERQSIRVRAALVEHDGADPLIAAVERILASRLAVHVSPETVEERCTGCPGLDPSWERIAQALLAVDPVEWALLGQDAGTHAAAIARAGGR